jgi:DNA-binding IclR family transcriptional regulator
MPPRKSSAQTPNSPLDPPLKRQRVQPQALAVIAHEDDEDAVSALASARDDNEADQYIVPALRRGLAVLRLFSRDRRVLTLPEIVREIGVSRATGYRLAYTLEADGYLKKAPHSNAFQLGLNVLSLGFEYLGSLDLLDVARPILEDLRSSMGLSVHMGVREGTDIVYVLSLPSQHRLRSNVSVGTRSPAHANSMGRATLFDSSLEELRKLFRGVQMERFSDQTPTNVSDLHKRLEEERLKGYVSWRSANIPGIATVSAPVRDREGCIVAAVNISDYESLPIMQEQEGRVKDAVLAAAMAISQSLGYRPRVL